MTVVRLAAVSTWYVICADIVDVGRHGQTPGIVLHGRFQVRPDSGVKVTNDSIISHLSLRCDSCRSSGWRICMDLAHSVRASRITLKVLLKSAAVLELLVMTSFATN